MKLAYFSDSITSQAVQDPSTLNKTFENKKCEKWIDFNFNFIKIQVDHF